MEVLNEMYFGKVIAIQQMEDVLQKLKIKYSTHNWANEIRMIQKDINRDPLVAKLAKYIKDQFGFGEVIVLITPTAKFRAGCIAMVADKHGIAYESDKRVDLKDSILVTSEGIRFDNKKISPNVLIMISMGILLSPLMTVEELMGALLHEIGHSFSKATLGSEEFNERIDEKFADQFATMYGYGAELAKALTKVATNLQYADVEKLRRIPIVNIFVGLNNIRKSLMGRFFGQNPHPGLNQRFIDSIRQMEYDLKNADNLTPEQKKELALNIQKTKQVVEDYYNDTPYMPDRMMKFYMRKIEPRFSKEIRETQYAEKYGSHELVNNKLMSKFKK